MRRQKAEVNNGQSKPLFNDPVPGSYDHFTSLNVMSRLSLPALHFSSPT